LEEQPFNGCSFLVAATQSYFHGFTFNWRILRPIQNLTLIIVSSCVAFKIGLERTFVNALKKHGDPHDQYYTAIFSKAPQVF
jgi:hypothetical protein